MNIGMVTAGISQASAGTTSVVLALARGMQEAGQSVKVYTGETSREDVGDLGLREIDITPAIKIRNINFGAVGVGKKIARDRATLRCIHVHGFWLYHFYTACKAGKAIGIPVILSPHGMFSDYSFNVGGTRKRIALRLGYRGALQVVSAFHATSAAEADEIRRLGLTQPIHVIPNGIDIPTIDSGVSSNVKTKEILFLSRIHPKKGADMLLRAWHDLASSYEAWSLVIAGEGDRSYEAQLKGLVEGMSIPRVTFVGPLFGSEKIAAMRRASIFVLPSYDENFGLVVGEALACGTPVLTTRRTPWQDLEEYRCGWLTEATLDGIEGGLRTALETKAAVLHEMGRRGARLVAEKYSWKTISDRFLAEVYAGLASVG
ncbi:glycosyltransferase [Mesorhizobium sp. M0913]|uniref:glycosyltransferase n=1 Tax=Mesorhizobium sp. M0913 TaxID=2957026 RepID=UPI00333B4712